MSSRIDEKRSEPWANLLAGGVGGADVLAGGVADGLAEEGVDGGDWIGKGVARSWFLVLDPATQSVSKCLVRSVTTLALMWKVPQERPSWIVWTVRETLPRIRIL